MISSALLAVFLLHGCAGGGEKELDPAATYEAYGASFEPSAAIPAQALIADAGSFIGRSVTLEGVLRDGCPPGSCWMILETGGESSIRVFLPTHDDGSYEFSPPPTAVGRRAVVRGSFTSGAAASTFNLRATGVMVEKVRS